MTATFELLQLNPKEAVEAFLRSRSWIEPDESVGRLSKAGEGNMNLVIRVQTTRRTLILKQSRPFVEKYPSIAAPEDRALVEAAFYRAVRGADGVSHRMPHLIQVDAEARTLLLEDLGSASDCTDAYAGAPLPVEELLSWLGALHALQIESSPELRNRDMRALNHAHLFDLPMTGAHGMDLDAITPGLAAAADAFRHDSRLARRVSELGDLYLSDGATLLHGDYYPGSWLRTSGGVRVIDPEFGFLGVPEFDLGVFKAHLIFCGTLRVGLEAYPSSYDATLVDAFAGVELMRRLIGVAQLPMSRSLEEKTALLDRAARLIAG